MDESTKISKQKVFGSADGFRFSNKFEGINYKKMVIIYKLAQ
jgi:hypothetical protein